MSSSATMEASYEVIDEELEAAAEPKKGKRKASGIANGDEVEEPVNLDTQADEMAKLMQDMANKASELAFNASLDRASKLCQEIMAKTERSIAELSAKYTKPQNLCLHVKINAAPPKKLKLRVSPLLPDVLMQADIGNHGGKWPLIMGPTGSGKTILARQVAETLEREFHYVNCSEGMGETVFFGKETVKGFVEGPLWKSVKYGHVMLFDEWDAASDNAAVSVNTILTSPSGSMVTNPFSGERVEVHANFIAIAATNTNGKGGDGAYTGRNRLDGASLNRFAMFELSYDPGLERELCPDTTLLERLWSIRVALQQKNAKDVISTRDIADAYAQTQRGYSAEKAMRCLMLRMDKSNQELFTTAPAISGSGRRK